MSDDAQYEMLERAATEATIQVTIPPQEVRHRLDSVYRRYGQDVRVPGFRKGHIPRSVLDSRFGRDAFLGEAQDELQRQHLPEAVSALSLRPMSMPKLEVVSFGEAEPFVFRASFSVLPRIELPDYKGLKVTVPEAQPVSEEDVGRALEEIQAQFGTLGEKEGEVVIDGDIVCVRERDQEWDTRADAGNPVTKALIGAEVGTEVEVDAQLSDEKRIRTTLEVVGLRQVILPEIDDELAKDAGFDDLDALKADIRAKLSASRAKRRQDAIDVKLLDALVERTDTPLPEPFVEDLMNEEMDRLKESLERGDSSSTFERYLEGRETSEEELREQFRSSISLRLRRELVLQELAEDASITIGDEELGELAEQDAEVSGEDSVRFIGRLKGEGRWEAYRTSKINERVFSLLRESAVVKEDQA